MTQKILQSNIIKFIFIACIYNVISILLYWFLLNLNVYYLISNVISALIGIILAYLLNTKFVFNESYTWKRFFKFMTVYLSNLIFSTIGMYVLVEVICINYYVAYPLMIVINVVYNFTFTKLWAMKG